jgi:cytochrome c oxidase subunit 4
MAASPNDAAAHADGHDASGHHVPGGLAAAHAGHGDHHAHVSSTGLFLGILLTLLALTWVTVWVSDHDFGGANMLVAMAIASVKAALVMAVFMHLLWDTPTNRLFFLCSLLFLSLLFVFIFADLESRSSIELTHGREAPLSFDKMGELNQAGSREKTFGDQFKERDKR